jgi:hypothetical protein
VGVGFKKQAEGSQEQALRGPEEAEITDLDEASRPYGTLLGGGRLARRGGLCPQSGMISLKGGDSVRHDDTYINPR